MTTEVKSSQNPLAEMFADDAGVHVAKRTLRLEYARIADMMEELPVGTRVGRCAGPEYYWLITLEISQPPFFINATGQTLIEALEDFWKKLPQEIEEANGKDDTPTIPAGRYRLP